MTASTRRELRSAATSTSTTAIGLIRALTDARPIKPTSTRCLSARRPNPGRGSTYRRGNPVQTTAATSAFPIRTRGHDLHHTTEMILQPIWKQCRSVSRADDVFVTESKALLLI